MESDYLKWGKWTWGDVLGCVINQRSTWKTNQPELIYPCVIEGKKLSQCADEESNKILEDKGPFLGDKALSRDPKSGLF